MARFLYNRNMANQQSSNRQRRRTQPQRNTSSTPPDHVGLLVASVIMMGIGWVGLYRLVNTTLPRLGGEMWLFFWLLQLAVTGTMLPVVRYVNVRFTSIDADVPTSGVIVRQSAWIGLFVVTCAWLRIPRALSLPLALFIALVFVVVEVLLRTREIAAENV